jgi:transposase
MNSNYLFKKALDLDSPWEVVGTRFVETESDMELHIDIDFKKGAKFDDENSNSCNIHDTKKKTWKHLDFFQHSCYLHCRVPRIITKEGAVKMVEVPWARVGSGFTLLFEAYVMALIEKEMPVNKAGVLVRENPHRLWNIFNYWVNLSYNSDPTKAPEKLGIDETSTRKGHDYVTLAVDIKERKVLHAAEGKGKEAIKAVKDHLETKDININKVKHVSMDMSPSFIAGVNEHFPKSEVHFDRFHVVKLLNEAMDKVRKSERKQHEALKGHKYTFLKNQQNLSDDKKEELNKFIKLYPILGEAYRLKILFNDLWEMESEEEAVAFLVDWCKEVDVADIQPFKKFANTVKSHWAGIVSFCETGITNGILEGINNKVQLAKRRARGYRRTENFINMIYFLCGKLKFDYPHNSS